MADVADRSDAESELHLQIALLKRKDTPVKNGSCHNCMEPVDKGCFCDAECRDDFERRNRMK